jgi:hypothetical protein
MPSHGQSPLGRKNLKMAKKKAEKFASYGKNVYLCNVKHEFGYPVSFLYDM